MKRREVGVCAELSVNLPKVLRHADVGVLGGAMRQKHAVGAEDCVESLAFAVVVDAPREDVFVLCSGEGFEAFRDYLLFSF